MAQIPSIRKLTPIGGVSVRVTTDSEPLKAIIRAMNRVAKDLSEPLEVFGTHMLNVIDQRFEQERDAAGHPWARLAPSTQRRRRYLARHGGLGGGALPITPAHPILYRTGELMAGNGFNVRKTEVGRAILTISNPAKDDSGRYYAQYHQNDEEHRKFLPRRSFLDFSKTDDRELSKIFEEWLHTIFAREANKLGFGIKRPISANYFRG